MILSKSCHQPYAPLIARDPIKDEEAIHQIIRDLIDLGRRANLPVLATGNVHPRPWGRDLSGNHRGALGQSSMMNWTIGIRWRCPASTPAQGPFQDNNEMLDEFNFLVRTWCVRLSSTIPTSPGALWGHRGGQEKDLYTPYIERGRKSRWLRWPMPRPLNLWQSSADIIDLHRERTVFHLGKWFRRDLPGLLDAGAPPNERGYLVGSRGLSALVLSPPHDRDYKSTHASHHVCPNCQHPNSSPDGSYGSGFWYAG